MDNLRIIYGKSIENPWIIYGYSIVLFFVYTICFDFLVALKTPYTKHKYVATSFVCQCVCS